MHSINNSILSKITNNNSDNVNLKDIKNKTVGTLLEIENNKKTVSEKKQFLNLHINNYNDLYNFNNSINNYIYVFYSALILLLIIILFIYYSDDIENYTKLKYYAAILLVFVIVYIYVYYNTNLSNKKIEKFTNQSANTIIFSGLYPIKDIFSFSIIYFNCLVK